MFLGLATAYAADSFDRTVSDPTEVEEITGKPVIGVIPSFGVINRAYGAHLAYGARQFKTPPQTVTEENPATTSVWLLDHPESAAAEAFRELRTAIMLSRAAGGPKIIMFTSCVPGEGKSTVSANMAATFAQQGKKVILIEADMRRPTMRLWMKHTTRLGLSSVLAGSCTSDEAIIRGVNVPTLDIMTAGPRPPMPSEILGSTTFNELLDTLRSRYDIILIDTPPALMVTDAVLISLRADVVVWVARANSVTRPYLARATSLIERNRMPVIGFVVNRMTRGAAGYGYAYQYSSSYYGKDRPDDA